MKIHEAISLIEKFNEPTSNKSEIKDKTKLLKVLKEVEGKDFTEKQKSLLEEHLTLLFESKDFNPKMIKESKEAFYSFLHNELFLVYKGYWKAFGAFIGSAFGFIGLTLAISFLDPYANYIVAPLISMAIGFVIGSILDSSIEKQGRTISTWP